MLLQLMLFPLASGLSYRLWSAFHICFALSCSCGMAAGGSSVKCSWQADCLLQLLQR